MMRRYAEHTGCRRSFLLSYFGQDYPGPCGNCDNDRARPAEASGPEPFAIGERVTSERWGEGTVQRYDGDQLTVLFDEHGYRDLLVPLVVERRLLRARVASAAHEQGLTGARPCSARLVRATRRLRTRSL